MDKKMKTDRILQMVMVSMALSAPMAIGGEVKEFGMGISREEAKLYSGAGIVERGGREGYLKGVVEAREGLVQTGTVKRVEQKGAGQTGKQVAKQAKKQKKQKVAKAKEGWGAAAGRKARLEREERERTGKSFNWEKYL